MGELNFTLYDLVFSCLYDKKGAREEVCWLECPFLQLCLKVEQEEGLSPDIFFENLGLPPY